MSVGSHHSFVVYVLHCRFGALCKSLHFIVNCFRVLRRRQLFIKRRRTLSPSCFTCKLSSRLSWSLSAFLLSCERCGPYERCTVTYGWLALVSIVVYGRNCPALNFKEMAEQCVPCSLSKKSKGIFNVCAKTRREVAALVVDAPRDYVGFQMCGLSCCCHSEFFSLSPLSLSVSLTLSFPCQIHPSLRYSVCET